MFQKTLLLLLVCIGPMQSSLYSQQNNYQYDELGRLTADYANGIVNIIYDNSNKVTALVKADTCTTPDVEITYDERGNRMSKLVKPRNGQGIVPEYLWKTTFYEYEPNGHLTVVYERTYHRKDEDSFDEIWTVTEYPLYARVRIGISEWDRQIVTRFLTANLSEEGQFINKVYSGSLIPAISSWSDEVGVRGSRKYEFADHLDNALLVSSDRKVISLDGSSMRMKTEVVSVKDYYPFGMVMPDRNDENAAYRYGFNGMEKDDEYQGKDNSYDFVGRSIYDPRLGRFVSIDPLFRDFAHNSPYSFVSNNPLVYTDKTGEQEVQVIVDPRQVLSAELAVWDRKLRQWGDNIVEGSEMAAKTALAVPAFVLGLSDTDKVKEWERQLNNGTLSPEEFEKNLDDLELQAQGAAELVTPIILKGLVSSGRYALNMYRLKKAQKAAEAINAAPKPPQKVPTAGSASIATACFVGDTEVLTQGGDFVFIKDIRTEEAYHFSEEELKELLEEREIKEFYIQIMLRDKELLVYHDQFFYVNDQWVKAEDLEKGDFLMRLDGTQEEVINVRMILKQKLAKQE